MPLSRVSSATSVQQIRNRSVTVKRAGMMIRIFRFQEDGISERLELLA